MNPQSIHVIEVRVNDEILPLGKLPPQLLAALLGQIPTDPRVIVGPRVGEDAAVIDMGDRYLVAKTDPITFAADEIGWYAVQVNANDLATTGAVPRWFMASVLLPGGQADQAMVETIFDQLLRACEALEIALVGGHTEITHGLDRPIVVGVLLGEVRKDRLVTTGGARPGDVVLLTKGFPIEAGAIIARERGDELTGILEPATLVRAAGYLTDPGLSVVRDAQIAMSTGYVTSMHDPTEGGVATALWELAEASGLTVRLDVKRWPILPEAGALCAQMGLDPLGAIASGALLMTVAPGSVAAIGSALADAGIAVHRLGKMAEGPAEVLHKGELLKRPERDEIARLFE